ncbi:MAG: hypothetical protein H6623_00525 [Bdellovibrionaceae bacterium]|nr:hypothetical protein [Pseudobdellovibrionaceae bacterium]
MQNYIVLVSGKISNSVLQYLERQGCDVQSILQVCECPVELLRDTSYWLQATKMEDILRQVDTIYLDLPEKYTYEVGRTCESLRSWGVLDSVLKMVESPLDIYGHPSRFLSYFLSPEPPIDGWKNDGEKISFNIPISSQEFPYITSYLAGALEGLPSYMGHSLATVDWQDNQISIQWSLTQEALLPVEDLQLRQFNPQWVRTVIDSLEAHQKNLDSRSRTEGVGSVSQEKMDELAGDTLTHVKTLSEDIHVLREDFLRLHDYFSRAQQLITFLVHSGRKTKQVDEAMRRMDWSQIQQSYEELVTRSCDRILRSRDRSKEFSKQLQAKISHLNTNIEETPTSNQLPFQ